MVISVKSPTICEQQILVQSLFLRQAPIAAESLVTHQWGMCLFCHWKIGIPCMLFKDRSIYCQ